MLYGINKIQISNYRSFAPKTAPFENLKPINILIGPNSSGKSNFANGLRLLLKPDTGVDFGGGYGKVNPDSEHDFFNKNESIILKCEFNDQEIIETHFKFNCETKKVEQIDEKKLGDKRGKFFSIGPYRSWPNWAKCVRKLNIIDDAGLRKKVEDKINRLLRSSHHKEITLPSQTNELGSQTLANYLLINDNVPSSEIGLGIEMFLYFIVEIENTIDAHIFLIEEPENHMHPQLQKLFLNYLIEWTKKGKQFFITTHSPFLINFAAEEVINGTKEGKTRIFRFSKRPNSAGKEYTIWKDCSGSLQQQREILQDLGIKASDVLQPNGIIWVEGPSDIIYIRRWLELYFKKYRAEKTLSEFREGIHYQIMWYGSPTLAYNIDFDWKSREAEKVINLVNLNPNCFFLVDADNFYKKSKKQQNQDVRFKLRKRVETSNFWMTDKPSGNFQKIKVKENSRKKFKLTLECYLPRDVLGSKPIDFKKKGGKVQFAKKVRDKLDENNFLEKQPLESRLKELYQCIQKWNK